MKREPEADRLPQEPTQPDDIEILEIVGFNDSPSPEGDGSEVEVSFDEDLVSGSDQAPAARSSAGARKAADAHERLLRLRADFENLKKRIERERDEYFRHATAGLVARLLPVLDNFERALASGRQSRNGEALLEGIALIQRQFLDELRREGLRAVECLGLPFDPTMHEAVATEANPRLPANTVVEEMQRGYHFDDRLLRPALVRVSVPGSQDGRAGQDPKES